MPPRPIRCAPSARCSRAPAPHASRARPLTAGRLTRFVEDVGGIQLDSINVLDRAHYLTVWARFGPTSARGSTG